MKKLIAIVLSAVMLMSVLSIGVAAGTTVTPYEVGARNTIVKFVDESVKKIAPVEIQVVKLPARFDGKIAVCYADDEVLESFNTLQFVAKYNTVYDVKATAEDSYGSGKVIYMNTAEDETLEYNKVVFIEIPEGYVVYPVQDLFIIDDTASWKITYEVITEEAYAAILAAEKAAAEPVAEEVAEPVEEVEAVVEETAEEAVEETAEEETENTINIDLDAIGDIIKEVLGEDFDFDAFLLDFVNEEGMITIEDFLFAYTLLINTELLAEDTVAAIVAAVNEFLGEEISAVFTEIIDAFLAGILEAITAEEATDEAPVEEATEEVTEEAPVEAPAA